MLTHNTNAVVNRYNDNMIDNQCVQSTADIFEMISFTIFSYIIMRVQQCVPTK